MAPGNRPDVEHGSPARALPGISPDTVDRYTVGRPCAERSPEWRAVSVTPRRGPSTCIPVPRIPVTFTYGASVPVRPPSGTVTFLFTSIQDSLRRWDEAPAEMAAAQRVHDA